MERPWSDLQNAYEAADRRWTEASAALADADDSQADSREELACDRARDAAWEAEEALLAAQAPNLAAAAYQLKIIAFRHHDVEMDEPRSPGDDTPDGRALRRIYELMRASGEKPPVS